MTRLTPRPAPTREVARPPLPRVDPITRLPIVILYPHSRCNCRCLMCDIWRATTRDEIAPEDVASWLEGWRALGVRRVVLSGGEALMHARLWDLCAPLVSAGIGITLLSTGLLLARHARELVRYCDDVVVSLDGPRAVHDAIRNVPRAFDRLAEGVAAVKAAAATAGVDVAVTGRCTVQRSNFHHLRATVDAAREIGLDRISFLAADVSSEAFNRPNGWDGERVSAIALTPEEVAELGHELDALTLERAADFEAGFIAESPAKLRRKLAHYYAALNGAAELPLNECNAPWVSSVIEADGTVRPCFFQPPLGNIHDADAEAVARHGSPLAAVLNAPGAVAWRRGLDVRHDEICRRCVCTLSLRE